MHFKRLTIALAVAHSGLVAASSANSATLNVPLLSAFANSRSAHTPSLNRMQHSTARKCNKTAFKKIKRMMQVNLGDILGDYVVDRELAAYKPTDPTLGKTGSPFTAVYRAKHTSGSHFVALKVAPSVSRSLVKAKNMQIWLRAYHMGRHLLSEGAVLNLIQEKGGHPNIIRSHGFLEHPTAVILALEYLPHDDLSKFNAQPVHTESTLKYLMRELAAGLVFMHENNIYHRDIKPQNILLRANSATPIGFEPVYADFGFSLLNSPQNPARRRYRMTKCGTPGFVAPDMFIDSAPEFDHAKIDVFALGAVFLVLATNVKPMKCNYLWGGKQEIRKLVECLSDSIREPPSRPLMQLILGMLAHNPQQRFTASDVLASPWLAADSPTSFTRTLLDALPESMKDCLGCLVLDNE